MTTQQKAPDKAFRAGVSLEELMEIFPNEQAASEWFEGIYWTNGRACGHCGSDDTHEVTSGKPMPYRCRSCRQYFSVKTGTAMAGSNIKLHKWAIGIYLCLTSLKSVSSMKLKRDLGIGQKAAWFMLHRLREAWDVTRPRDSRRYLQGPVEVDESYIGGTRRNVSLSKRAEQEGRGPVNMAPVVGLKDRASNEVRAQAVQETDADTLQGFIAEQTDWQAQVYTDEAVAHRSLPFKHEAVRHSVNEYVRGKVHTNGMESFWAMLKRAYTGTFHKISPKHLNRYVQEFAGRHNIRELDTLLQIAHMARGLAGKRLKYHDLIADNGLSSGARA